jgi:hypothetical protein
LKRLIDILKKFDQKHHYAPSSAASQPDDQPGVDPSKTAFKASKLTKRSKIFHLSLEQLKWPLSKVETSALIEQIERHKNTCVLALSTENW